MKFREASVQSKNFDQNSAHITDLFLKQFARFLPQYLFWKDHRSVYLGCNQSYAELAGFSSPDEIIGKTDAASNNLFTILTARFMLKVRNSAARRLRV